jgi:hypothetical protein
MNSEDELRELWCAQVPRGQIPGEDLLALVQKRIHSFDRVVTVRNLVESAASGFAFLIFAWLGWSAQEPLMRAGYLLIAAGAAWVIYYLVRYGKNTVSADPSQSLPDYTRALVERYDHQIRLLKSVKYWYLMPIYAGLLFTSVGLFLEHGWRTPCWRDFDMPALYTAAFAAVWWLNEVYSVDRLRKQRASLLSMIEDNELTRSEK